jgi:hypothetical protein
MPRHGGRVEGLERKAEGATTEHRLLYVSYLFGAVVLVELFKVHHTEIAKRNSDGFQLAGVVQTVELDGLPGGNIGQSVWLLGLLPEMPDAHPVNHAVVLRPDAGGNGVADLAQDDRVDVRHPHDEQHHFGGCKGGLQAAAPTIAQILVILT